MNLLTPKLDLVFKKMLIADTEILINLINSALKLSGDQCIRSVELKNPTVLPEEIEQKFIVLDILAVDETGHQYDIEMQVRKYSFYQKRMLYYLCMIYAAQLGAGKNYDRLSLSC